MKLAPPSPTSRSEFFRPSLIYVSHLRFPALDVSYARLLRVFLPNLWL